MMEGFGKQEEKEGGGETSGQRARQNGRIDERGRRETRVRARKTTEGAGGLSDFKLLDSEEDEKREGGKKLR